MKIIYLSLTGQGEELAGRLSETYPGQVVTGDSLRAESLSLAQKVQDLWPYADGFVFIMAAGIVVRTISPLLKNKACDPAVVVMDQEGKWAISLLSGHLGGANALAQMMARVSGGTAVITTGTDTAHTLAFDLFAQEHHLRIENLHELKYVSMAMIAKDPVTVYSAWPVPVSFPKNVRRRVISAPQESPEASPEGWMPAKENSAAEDSAPEPSAKENSATEPSAGKDSATEQSAKKVSEAELSAGEGPVAEGPAVWIGHAFEEIANEVQPVHSHVLWLRPKNLYIGVGCKKAVDPVWMRTCFEDFLVRCRIDIADLCGLATIALKQEEPAVCALCEHYGLKLQVMDAQVIDTLEHAGAVTPSEFVRKTAGVGSVCEACALAAAGAKIAAASKAVLQSDPYAYIRQLYEQGWIRLERQKTKYKGITFALAQGNPWAAEGLQDGLTINQHQS